MLVCRGNRQGCGASKVLVEGWVINGYGIAGLLPHLGGFDGRCAAWFDEISATGGGFAGCGIGQCGRRGAGSELDYEDG